MFGLPWESNFEGLYKRHDELRVSEGMDIIDDVDHGGLEVSNDFSSPVSRGAVQFWYGG